MAETRKQIENQIIEKAMKDEQFRKKLINNPKDTLEKELGTKFPEGLNIHINSESDNDIYITLPGNTEELSEEELSGVSGAGWLSSVSCNLNSAKTQAIEI